MNDITERKQQCDAEYQQLIQELGEAQELLRADLDATNRLLKVGSLFLHEGNLKLVLGEIVDTAIAITGADFGNIQLLEGGSSDLVIAVHRGFPEWWVEFWNKTVKGCGTCGEALERHGRVIVEDVQTSPIFADTPDLKMQVQAGVRAVQSTPLFGRAGKPIGVLSTHFRTPGRPSDRRLQLFDLLARQTADILERAQAEQALRNAKAQLLEAERRKNEFLGMLSHELRNPLAPIRNSIEILARSPPGSEQAHRAHAVIDRQAGHMTRIIEDLLDITRITSGRVQLQRILLDLNELAQRTVEDHRGAFADSGVEIEMLADPSELWVNGDRTRLAQVIGNLLQNAVKFTPRGGRTTVSVERNVSHGQAMLRVQDTGVGMAPELLPRLFEAFTQGDPKLDRSSGGLGLGLAVVKALVEMHGGSVRAESGGLRKGAAFTVALPLESPPKAEIRPDIYGEERRRHILIIEDSNDAADTLRDVLELGGHEVEVAYTGPEGLEKARGVGPDLVFCDIGLPVMDGYQVARAMRADPKLGRITLVALTGYAGPQDLAMAREAGFDAHLAKPASIEALARVMADTWH